MYPDGSMGIRKHFESPYRKGEKITIEEYYQYVFERVKGLPEVAKAEGLSELQYMSKYGAFEIEKGESYKKNENAISDEQMNGAVVDDDNGVIRKNGKGIHHQ